LAKRATFNERACTPRVSEHTNDVDLACGIAAANLTVAALAIFSLALSLSLFVDGKIGD
jgi:hypothetical protein